MEYVTATGLEPATTLFVNEHSTISQLTFTYSKSTRETLEKGVKYALS